MGKVSPVKFTFTPGKDKKGEERQLLRCGDRSGRRHEAARAVRECGREGAKRCLRPLGGAGRSGIDKGQTAPAVWAHFSCPSHGGTAVNEGAAQQG